VSPSALTIRFTRTSPTRHRVEFLRADGTREEADLETRSLLLHDFVHFAIETEGRIRDGFYGRIARGIRAADLAHPQQIPGRDDELMATERVVGPLQTAWRRGANPDAFVAKVRDHLESVGAAVPTWLEADLVRRAMATITRLDGQWRATPFGAAMELAFAAAPAPA